MMATEKHPFLHSQAQLRLTGLIILLTVLVYYMVHTQEFGSTAKTTTGLYLSVFEEN